jgi:3-(3-hydroxy-phenyl)propionate hydroxylase
VIFVGDSAHVVSPFGARGGNGGVQDADNLGWKLAAVLKGAADARLLETYDAERGHGAAENIANSARATNFMTPKSPIEALFRAETLRMAHDHPFARRLINSGRLSVPCSLAGFALQTEGEAPVAPGSAVVDAPLEGSWLLREVQGDFVLVGFGEVALPEVAGLRRLGIGQACGEYRCCDDPTGLARARYGEGYAYLFRPDGHVAAAFRAPSKAAVRAALDRAMGKALMTEAA